MSERVRDLRDLVHAALPGVTTSESVLVRGVSTDSRVLDAGELFVAVPGSSDDGGRHVQSAVAAGAVAVVASTHAELPRDLAVPLVRVADPRRAVGRLAATFHGHPSQSMRVVGVTGTNGKTTTAHLLRAALGSDRTGDCAVLGTIAHEWGGHRLDARNTTPGAAELQSLLARARADGCRSVAMEVSSHALDQHRVEGVQFDAGVFTNLTGDHLDYHGAMEDYAAAKARLFSGLGGDAVAVLNAEDPYTPTMARGCRARIRTYGLDGPADPDVSGRELELTAAGVRFRLVCPEGDAPIESRLVGRYNVLNLLAAAAAATGLGLGVEEVAAALSSVEGVRGRLEAVDRGQSFRVLVDYAHTDDAVTNVLRNLRAVVDGRLLVVVGCGGDRDRGKRPRMARAAAEFGDLAWFTSDNPRGEEPRRIVDDMLSGVHGARNVRVELDRRCAIHAAIAEARDGDCVAILGKGHEDYQVLGARTIEFDDRVVAAEALEEIVG